MRQRIGPWQLQSDMQTPVPVPPPNMKERFRCLTIRQGGGGAAAEMRVLSNPGSSVRHSSPFLTATGNSLGPNELSVPAH